MQQHPKYDQIVIGKIPKNRAFKGGPLPPRIKRLFVPTKRQEYTTKTELSPQVLAEIYLDTV